jgi:hypothetical protein
METSLTVLDITDLTPVEFEDQVNPANRVILSKFFTGLQDCQDLQD